MFKNLISRLPRLNREKTFVVVLMCALCAFEIFNFCVTHYALSVLLSELSFAGIAATIFAITFCGIDYSGVGWLFTPSNKQSEEEAWYFFGIWFIAATINAVLTWWGVSLALLGRDPIFGLSRVVFLRVVPVFVAGIAWVIRILIIGTFFGRWGHAFSDFRR